MSSIRLNISDAERAINGEVHGCFADAVMAALTAEPETIDELGLALARFIKPLSDLSPFAWLQKGESFEPYDAGVVVIDLAALGLHMKELSPHRATRVRRAPGGTGGDVVFLAERPTPAG